MNKLTIQEYQKLAKRTCPSLGDKDKDFLHMEMGIITEIGEIIDIQKKELAYKKPIDLVHLKEELGDLSWYIANWATFKQEELISNEETISYFSDINLYNCLKYVIVNLEDEEYDLTDVIAIVEAICIKNGLDFQEVLYTNIEKLKKRYPEGFTEEKALNRDLDTERKILEQ